VSDSKSLDLRHHPGSNRGHFVPMAVGLYPRPLMDGLERVRKPCTSRLSADPDFQAEVRTTTLAHYVGPALQPLLPGRSVDGKSGVLHRSISNERIFEPHRCAHKVNKHHWQALLPKHMGKSRA